MEFDSDKISDKRKGLGQVFTDYKIANFMVSLSSLSQNKKILDPCTGVGVFISALANSGFKNITAIEIDKTLIPKELSNKVMVDNFLKIKFDSKFDLIIGNPPYVRTKNLPQEFKEYLNSDEYWHNKVNALSDLLQTFIFKSIDLLEEDGELIFITPFFWLQSLHAQKLRDYLIKNGYFKEIIHFGEHKLFKDAATNTIIFRYVKGKSNDRIKIIEMNGKGNEIDKSLSIAKNILAGLVSNGSLTIDNSEGFKIEQFKLGSVWDIFDPKLNKKFELMGKKSISLSQICDIRVGMVTGLESAFKISSSFFKKLTKNEQEKIIFVLKGKDMDKFFTKTFTPYIKVDDINNEKTLRKLYPLIYAHLSKFKNNLKKRYDYNGSIDWWKWAFPRNERVFLKNKNKPKIFVPSKDRTPYSRFCYTADFCFGTQDSVVLTKKSTLNKESMKYILCLLNSNLLNEWYKSKGIRRGDVRQYSLQPMSKIPIRQIDWSNINDIKNYKELEEIADKIITSKDYSSYLKHIDRIINELYLT